MINIKRTYPGPASLDKKAFDGVKAELISMQANKCYLCERKAPETSHIEHFYPASKNEELKYVWENLFLSCDHCNSIKNYKSDGKNPSLDLLDCTNFSTIISDVIEFYCEGKPREKVIIKAVNNQSSPSINDTVFLLHNIFNYDSESLAFDSKVLTDEVIIEMKKLLDLLHEYEFDCHTDEKRDYILMHLKNVLSMNSPFTAFKIWYIKRNYAASEFVNLLPTF